MTRDEAAFNDVMQKNYRAKCRLHMFSCANTDESTREQQHPQMFVGKSLKAKYDTIYGFLAAAPKARSVHCRARSDL